MPLPQAVSALVTDRLSAVDAALPGFVTTLWVTGSAASGDWRPARSDVDFVGSRPGSRPAPRSAPSRWSG